MQIMAEKEADSYHLNPFDLTKVWPYKDYPLVEVGELVLDRNPENYFADVEQAAFSPGNIVPGLSFSPDKMLQARLIAYHDAHLYRVGTNYQQLPVNRSASPVNTYQRDGAMRFDGNSGRAPNYEPNSYANAPKEAPEFREPALKISGDADRYDHRVGNDDYTQPGNLFRLMTRDEQDRLTTNIANAVRSVPEAIKLRQIGHFLRADRAYGKAVAEKLQLSLAQVEKAAA